MNANDFSRPIGQNQDGFTLIELLIAMAMSGVLMGALFGSLITLRKSYDVQEQVTEMTQTARSALDMMAREVLMAGYNPARVSFMGITYSLAQLQIKADLDGNGVLTDTNENIIYTFDAPNRQIDRNTGGGGQPFAENIDGFSFSYLDVNGTATTTSANIRQVRLTITVRTARPDRDYKSNGGYRKYTLTSTVTPRNLAF